MMDAVGPSSTTRPRYRTSRRSARRSTTARSCEMKRSARPVRSCRSSNRLMIWAATETSRADTGSSQTSSFGAVARARAMATRCAGLPRIPTGIVRPPRAQVPPPRGDWQLSPEARGAARASGCATARRSGPPPSSGDSAMSAGPGRRSVCPAGAGARPHLPERASLPPGTRPCPNRAARNAAADAPSSSSRCPILRRARASLPAR